MDDLKIIDYYNNADDKKKEAFSSHINSNLRVITDYNSEDYDYEWLDRMEKCIRYLDNILRNPNRFIVNEEDIVKIELARRVTVESIKHLSRNTNLIQDYDKKTGDVKPSKILNINKEGIKKQGRVQAEDIYVDGSRVGDVSNVVVKDRKLMANNGILAIIINIDTKNKVLLNNPLVTTRGYILVNESAELIKEIELYSKKIILGKLKGKNINFGDIKNELINSLMPMLADKTGRVPIILPIIMDIKGTDK